MNVNIKDIDFAPEMFENWLQKDEVKILLSMIPETSNNDIFLGLLKAAYKAGFNHGQTTMGISLLKEIVTSQTQKPNNNKD